MASTKVPTEDYVTIVSVGNNEEDATTLCLPTPPKSDTPFVTVLSIGSVPLEEEVTIYRLPGEKLGFGLKFEGGTKSAECVRRLYIQSCSPDSPAGRARAAWGPLEAGDEILFIDNFPVTSLTRLECVRCLKDSNVAVTLHVRHDVTNKFECDENTENILTKHQINGDKICDTSALPPPVPPRKLHRKKDGESAKTLKSSENISRSSESLIIENGIKKGSAKNSPCRPRKPVPTPSPPPPEAQVYTDLFLNEKDNGVHVAESESDDTGSSISTVIDRLSMYSSFPGSVDNSIPSTPTLGSKQLNFQSVFSCLDSIGQSLMADMPPSIVEEKMKVTKSPHMYSSYEKLPLVKTKSNASEDSINTDNVMFVQQSFDKKVETDNEIDSELNKSSLQKDSNNNKKTTKETHVKESIPPTEDVVDGSLEISKKTVPVEAPKPKPRTINKKNLDNTFGQRKYDESLSLTKIHCIESWLQDSIGCKITHDSPSDTRDEDQEIIRPEALPRLIDFVPKSIKNQTVSSDNPEKVPEETEEISNEVSSKDIVNNLRLIVTRDPSQDWCSSSGSPHLETIYEDLSTCPTLLIEESSRHPPAGDSGSDQGNHPSLEGSHASVIEVILPEISVEEATCQETESTVNIVESEECTGVAVSRGPRSPPDGRENPAIHHEDVPPPLPPTIYENIKFHSEIIKLQQPSKIIEVKEVNKKDETSGRQQSIFQQPPKKTLKDWEKKFTRGKDDKCNGSVKDKIAMFSANKSNSLESPYSPPEKKILSVNKVDMSSHNAPPVARSISLQMEPVLKYQGISERNTMTKKMETVNFGGTLPRKSADKNNSSVLYSRTLSYDSGNESRASAHKNTLNQLIEQRRQSMNKLRGLVIPDSPRVLNLPEIKSKDSLDLTLSSLREDNDAINKKGDSVRTPIYPLSVPAWESQPVVTNIPKYSPAFKRKPLQVYGPKLSRDTKGDLAPSVATKVETKYQAPVKPPRTSLDIKKVVEIKSEVEKVQTLPPSFKSFSLYSNQMIASSKSPENSPPYSKDVVDSPCFKTSKVFTDTMDSDNDSSYLSTVSSPTPSLNTVDNTESDCSSQSALSQSNEKHFHKNDSLFDYNGPIYRQENGKTAVCRSLSSDTSTSGGSSNSSTLTSGSQASCSSAGSTDTGGRVLKPRSIEAINRKNILASAKCRSGKDKYGSPLIERKFSDVESTDDDTTVKAEPHFVKPRNDPTSNSIMKVAYSTLVVEDKFSQNETDTTYSDDSDCDYGTVALSKSKLSHRYSNGVSTNGVNKDTTKEVIRPSNINNGINSHLPKRVAPIEVIDKKIKTIDIKTKSTTVNNNATNKNNGIGTPKKLSESDSLDLSSCCVSEDEQDNLCEVKLLRGVSGGVGVTLAGGSDCEAKQVTIHKVLQGSAAERDGRLRKGDRVISVNGHSMKNVTHAQSVAILKEQLPEVSIVICSKRKEINNLPSENNESSKISTISVVLDKTDDSLGSAGLGISLQGGGIAPLVINKLFTGGVAANSGKIQVGSELLAVGETKVTGYTRTQAWGLLRGLPVGPVTLLLRPP